MPTYHFIGVIQVKDETDIELNLALLEAALTYIYEVNAVLDVLTDDGVFIVTALPIDSKKEEELRLVERRSFDEVA